jgi:copper chaperone
MEKQLTLTVQNMKCGGCANTITNTLLKIEGVHGVHVDETTGSITLDEWTEASLPEIHDELHRLGYPMVDEENSVFSKVKSYASCVVGRMSNPTEQN